MNSLGPFRCNFVNELKKSMVKNTNIQVVDNLTDNFRGSVHVRLYFSFDLE